MDPITLAALSAGGGALGNLIGGFQQQKAARDALNFQKQQYYDWQNARAQNEAALNEGFKTHFDSDGNVKGAGFLAQGSPQVGMQGMPTPKQELKLKGLHNLASIM